MTAKSNTKVPPAKRRGRKSEYKMHHKTIGRLLIEGRSILYIVRHIRKDKTLISPNGLIRYLSLNFGGRGPFLEWYAGQTGSPKNPTPVRKGKTKTKSKTKVTVSKTLEDIELPPVEDTDVPPIEDTDVPPVEEENENEVIPLEEPPNQIMEANQRQRTYKKRIQYSLHYQLIGKLLMEGRTYGEVLRAIRPDTPASNQGGAIWSHITKKFGGREQFIKWWDSQQDDVVAERVKEKERVDQVQQEIDDSVEVYKREIAKLNKELLVAETVISLCEKKLTSTKVDGLRKIAQLMVTNIAGNNPQESLSAITGIIDSIEDYVTTPTESNVPPIDE